MGRVHTRTFTASKRKMPARPREAPYTHRLHTFTESNRKMAHLHTHRIERPRWAALHAMMATPSTESNGRWPLSHWQNRTGSCLPARERWRRLHTRQPSQNRSARWAAFHRVEPEVARELGKNATGSRWRRLHTHRVERKDGYRTEPNRNDGDAFTTRTGNPHENANCKSQNDRGHSATLSVLPCGPRSAPRHAIARAAAETSSGATMGFPWAAAAPPRQRCRRRTETLKELQDDDG